MDSRKNLVESYLLMCDEVGIPPEEQEFSLHIGHELSAILEKLHPGLPCDMLSSIFRQHSARLTDLILPFAGAYDLVQQALEMTANVACVTSKDFERACQALELAHLPSLRIFSPSMGLPAKPAPDLILRAKSELGGGSACFFGDTSFDEMAATGAGVKFWRCGWGYGSWLPEDLTLPSPVEARIALVEWHQSLNVS